LDALVQPIKIAFGSSDDWDSDDLRRLVAVKRDHLTLKLFEFRLDRFGDQKNFRLSLNSSLPSVNGFHWRQDLNTGCQASTHQHFRDSRCLFTVSSR